MSFFGTGPRRGLCCACGMETVGGTDVFLSVDGEMLSFHVDECSHVRMNAIVGAIVAAAGVADPDVDTEDGIG